MGADVGISPYGSGWVRGDVGIAPYDGAQKTLAVLNTNRDKVCAWLAVIIVSQAISFSRFQVLQQRFHTQNRVTLFGEPV